MNHLDSQNSFFLCAGHAEGITPLSAFDEALRVAGIGDLNLVRMSSVLPPGVVLSDPPEFRPGTLIPVAYGSETSWEYGDFIVAAVAVARPEDPTKPGIIMELHRKTVILYAVPADVVKRRAQEDAVREVEQMARDALSRRKTKIKDVISIAAAFHVCAQPAAVFAGLVMFNKSSA